MFQHITVLKQEAVDGLRIKPDGIYVDCTLGGAGHSERIASHLNESGLLIGFDQDDTALKHARQILAPYQNRTRLVKSNFRYLQEVLDELDVPKQDQIPQVD
ncbi:MAG: 16S rRNA (cytosine(1402)-N(4))-methyltransferase, partial [Paenibacillus sp. RIFOXYA1_FULL_44_5]